jgi:hypothetical protein
MKKLIQLSLAGLALLGTLRTQAFTYHDEDVLLVFRKPGYDNVLFNLGGVSQFLGKPSGYTTVVSNFNLSLVTSTFGSDLSDDVRVLLLAVTSQFSANRRAWVSSAEANTPVFDRTSSQWQSQLFAKINGIGDKPQSYTATSSPPSYVISPSHISSYDYIASEAHTADNDLAKLGGSTVFTVEQAAPASLLFWQIRPSALLPKPASTLIGTFTFAINGLLTFSVDGVVPPPTLRITRANGTNNISFPTTSGGTYSLRWTNALGSAVANWATAPGTVSGNGATQTLVHTSPGATAFYSVERNP